MVEQMSKERFQNYRAMQWLNRKLIAGWLRQLASTPILRIIHLFAYIHTLNLRSKSEIRSGLQKIIKRSLAKIVLSGEGLRVSQYPSTDSR